MNSMKDTLKETLPQPMVSFVKRVLNGYPSLIMSSLREARRFNKVYAKDSATGVEQLEARMVYFTHQIEKGLSHKQFRYGFGKKPLRNLSEVMARYRKANPNCETRVSYVSAMATIGEYVRRHAGHDAELRYVSSLFPSDLLRSAERIGHKEGGSLSFSRDEKCRNSTLPFRQLNEHRHSIREFAETPITLAQLQPAIESAMRTPSVCNRQPTRVRVILNKGVIEKALSIQGGLNGYPTPPALILLTADNRVFMAPQEHNEGYTDAGLFGMNLLLALEAEGIGSCPLNTMFRKGPERATRALLRIPANESLIMYIAVGHFPEECTTCVSRRLPAEDIVTVIE
ncbi:nitroreductase family protein [Bifidobacterium choerinum]|uniref:nitroreductase family protein n=1 Tax=Bifidobacterium choerinum TaxID=35760 RepID=UPI003F92556E